MGQNNELITVQLENMQITAPFDVILNRPEYQHVKRVYAHYTPGNVCWDWYWRKYDLVRAFTLLDYGSWEVTVISCDDAGNPLADKKERVHRTTPDEHDEVEFNIYETRLEEPLSKVKIRYLNNTD